MGCDWEISGSCLKTWRPWLRLSSNQLTVSSIIIMAITVNYKQALNCMIYNIYLDIWLCYSICQGWQLWNRGGLWDYREKRWTGREHETDLCMWWGQCHLNPIFNTLVSSCTLCVIRTLYSILFYHPGDYLGREKQTSSWTWSSSMITTFHSLCD